MLKTWCLYFTDGMISLSKFRHNDNKDYSYLVLTNNRDKRDTIDRSRQIGYGNVNWQQFGSIGKVWFFLAIVLG